MASFAPHPLTLRQLQYAVAVADARNFRRAAELCHVSQPSLSAQLAQLEDVLGTRLFERERRPLILTPAGEQIVERARRLLVDTDDLVGAARQLGDPLSGSLRIGVIPTISPYLLPEIVPGIRRQHPHLTALWVEDKTETLVASLAEGRIDAPLLTSSGPAVDDATDEDADEVGGPDERSGGDGEESDEALGALGRAGVARGGAFCDDRPYDQASGRSRHDGERQAADNAANDC